MRNLLALLSLLVLLGSACSDDVSGDPPARRYDSGPATFYISPNGSDSIGDGSIDNPWQSLERARDAVRSLAGNMSGDIVVYLGGGTYPLSNTLLFTPSDSGTNGFTVYYKSQPGEVPVVSGGKTISGWVPEAGGIYRADVGPSD